jgi:hypothetical protein
MAMEPVPGAKEAVVGGWSIRDFLRPSRDRNHIFIAPERNYPNHHFADLVLTHIANSLIVGDGSLSPPGNRAEDWCIMKNIFTGLALLVIGGIALASERTVIVPNDTKPFTVQKADIVRLTGKGIAGSKIEIKVEGPAKVQDENNVFQKVGGRNLIGNQIKEFELQPTDTGRVTVTITVTPPQPDAKATKTKYEFEVK